MDKNGAFVGWITSWKFMVFLFSLILIAAGVASVRGMDKNLSVGLAGAFVGWITSGKFMVFLSSLILITAGVASIRALTEQSPLAPYALQIVGLLFITPVLLLLSATTDIKADVIVGLLGTIVGYIFGSARVQESRQIQGARYSDSDAGSVVSKNLGPTKKDAAGEP